MTTGQAVRSTDEIREEIVVRAGWTFAPVPGSPWRVEGTNARGGAFWVEGEILEADPPRLLTYTWKPSWIDVPRTTVRITLEPAGEGTRLVWRHSGFEGYHQALEDHRAGLPSVIRWLARFVEAA